MVKGNGCKPECPHFPPNDGAVVELRWTPSALRDLDAAGAYISQDNPRAAREIGQWVLQAVEYLQEHPTLGRSGRLRGTRELVVSGSPFIDMGIME